jgi:hypothetical protein
MDVTIVLIIVNICVSAVVAPLVIGAVDIMKRLHKSQCCGCQLELEEMKRKKSETNLTDKK